MRFATTRGLTLFMRSQRRWHWPDFRFRGLEIGGSWARLQRGLFPAAHVTLVARLLYWLSQRDRIATIGLRYRSIP